MRKQRLTSKQVAQRAGVSQTTVSFVLNNVDSANISEETKQRVWEAANALGYVPNAAARALARGQSSTIGLVLAHPHPQVFIDEYIPKIMTGLSQVMHQNGYRILVELLDDSRSSSAYMDLIRSREIAGIILNYGGSPKDDEALEELVSFGTKGFPVITLDHYHPSLHCVTVNKYDGVRQVVQHLIDLGHRKIACITYGPVPQDMHITRRLSIFRDTLQSSGIEYDASLVRIGAYDPETGYDAMLSLLDSSMRPTALYAMNDVMAFGAMKAIRDRNLRVPEDIAVVGFDDVRLAAYSQPALTTVFEPDVEHGRLAGETLLRLINGQRVSEMTIELPTKLVIRDSCGFHQMRANEGASRISSQSN
ncbi:MAG: LacI family DNA-binding transcriptional regulator [Aggregatilineales bacterium]